MIYGTPALLWPSYIWAVLPKAFFVLHFSSFTLQSVFVITVDLFLCVGVMETKVDY
jgi:hypothetical protein